MSKFFEDLGVSLGEVAQWSYDLVGEGLKAVASLWGTGMAKFLEFDGWLVGKAWDFVSWSVSTGWDVVTGSWLLPALGGNGDQEPDATHAPSSPMTSQPPGGAIEAQMSPGHLHADLDLIGTRGAAEAPDWHHP
ncbi:MULTISPECIES: hypothetical protein [unclassified Chelatococcus]|uniref:hypothetical protein n=1 Tax=unclassified Chelatococcus TaxID=2638111 RepID=UPI001BCBAC4C|nr:MULTISPECIES: hypothetical protein [unclassified Chelatococcus]MBS7698364.1 hypothetical protein [Chelatococcus sp. YT9]MBX3558869.1 hypothetical protein [Chelatococcus sp.]